jgi:hypothetical protein
MSLNPLGRYRQELEALLTHPEDAVRQEAQRVLSNSAL